MIQDLIHGDCLEKLREIESNSLDSLVTDPPAGISFMGKDWDKDKGGRDNWIAWMTEVMQECYRVLKPGAHGLVWAIPRTSHWTATALENAGFEVRDVVTHLFGSGFPKSLNVSKAIDKAAGIEREAVPLVRCDGKIQHNKEGGGWAQNSQKYLHHPVSERSTDAAKQWDGWGTALKPASEHWILVRKPISEKTVAANVLKWGCGGINIDGCRIGTETITTQGYRNGSNGSWAKQGMYADDAKYTPTQHQGRFPANLVLSHNHDCELVGNKKVKGIKGGCHGSIFSNKGETKNADYASEDGTETVEAWQCTEGCAVKMLDEQSGILKSGSLSPRNNVNQASGYSGGSYANRVKNTFLANHGSASRFFYCAKASKRDKGGGNTHPTVKNTRLMEYLIKLVTPPGGAVLDPFMGSGSTGVSAKRLGFKFVGVEQSSDYMYIAQSRINSQSIEVV